MESRFVETRAGRKVHVLEGGSGRPLIFLHGAGGLFEENPFLESLTENFHVLAPEWPGYGQSTGEDSLEDMLDFTLHGWDVVDALELGEKPHLMGHSMGGMIAAEMACTAPSSLGKLALICPAGLWLDEYPIPDLFSMLPHEWPPVLAHDPAFAMKLLTAGVDFNDPVVLEKFLVDNAKRMGTAGKILFPIPNRRLSKRLYRLQAETLIAWGKSDKLIAPAYGERWSELLPHAKLEWFDDAGHLLPYEVPDAFVATVTKFLG